MGLFKFVLSKIACLSCLYSGVSVGGCCSFGKGFVLIFLKGMCFWAALVKALLIWFHRLLSSKLWVMLVIGARRG